MTARQRSTRAAHAARARHRCRRVLEVFDRATAADLAAGLEWYARAESAARALAAGTAGAITVDRAAGALAALSPRVSWSQNLRGAALMVDAAAAGRPAPRVAGVGSNRAKAWAILTAPAVAPLDILRGDKVRAFYRNITGDVDAVTIDIWAMFAADGRALPAHRMGLTAHEYARYAGAYRAAAGARGTDPRTMQATVWVATRGRAD